MHQSAPELNMQTNLIPQEKPLVMEAELLCWLAAQRPTMANAALRTIGIRSEAGPLYRIIKTSGLTEYLRCLYFLAGRLGLAYQLNPRGARHEGCDAIFSLRRSSAAGIRPANAQRGSGSLPYSIW
jgi:hypothetical protein